MRPPFDLERLGRDLPFAAALPALLEAVAGPGTAVVQAPPGTGKTTLVPPALAVGLAHPYSTGKYGFG